MISIFKWTVTSFVKQITKIVKYYKISLNYEINYLKLFKISEERNGLRSVNRIPRSLELSNGNSIFSLWHTTLFLRLSG